MDRNSLSKSSESNNTIDEPKFENVHSVAEHEAIELSGEAISSVEEERRKSKSNVIQYLTIFFYWWPNVSDLKWNNLMDNVLMMKYIHG